MAPIEDLHQQVRPELRVRLFVGPITTLAVDDGTKLSDLWVAMALDLVADRAVGLGLYDAPPHDAHLLSLLDEAAVHDVAMGTVWSCACTAVETDRALLWTMPDTSAWLAQRGIRLHGTAPPGPAADEESQKRFSRMVTSLCKTMRRCGHARDEGRRTLLTRQAAVEAAQVWREAVGAFD